MLVCCCVNTLFILVSKTPIFVITEEPIPLGSPIASLNSFIVSKAAGAPSNNVSNLVFCVLISVVLVEILVVFVETLFDISFISVIFVFIFVRLLALRGPMILSTFAILISNILTLESIVVL